MKYFIFYLKLKVVGFIDTSAKFMFQQQFLKDQNVQMSNFLVKKWLFSHLNLPDE